MDGFFSIKFHFLIFFYKKNHFFENKDWFDTFNPISLIFINQVQSLNKSIYKAV